MNNSKQNYRFSGHNTFTPRFHWFNKVCLALSEYKEDIFNINKGVTSYYGVGKNMVQAIAYWSLAIDIINKNKSNYNLTEFGNKLFADNLTKDSYLENLNTIWLLHIHLVSNKENATAFWLFNNYNEIEFSLENAIEAATTFWKDNNQVKVAKETIKRDVSTFLNTYAPRKKQHVITEELLETPFADLNLISYLPEYNKYKKIKGQGNQLHELIITYALLHYWDLNWEGTNTLSLSKTCFGPGSPGNILQISQNELENNAENIRYITKNRIQLDDSSGSLDWRYEDDFLNEFNKIKNEVLLQCLRTK